MGTSKFGHFYFKVTIKLLTVTKWIGDRVPSKRMTCLFYLVTKEKQVGSWENEIWQKKTQRKLLAVDPFLA